MKIGVTAEDIEQGVRFSPKYCPVALALRRHANEVQVGLFNVYIKGYWIPLLLPTKVVKFITDFDFKMSVEPFFFDLEIPCKSV